MDVAERTRHSNTINLLVASQQRQHSIQPSSTLDFQIPEQKDKRVHRTAFMHSFVMVCSFIWTSTRTWSSFALHTANNSSRHSHKERRWIVWELCDPSSSILFNARESCYALEPYSLMPSCNRFSSHQKFRKIHDRMNGAVVECILYTLIDDDTWSIRCCG